tara:strand:- start:341 stop:1465 length:1125 start_codon:yes stop_codon:yes gene_type:complete
MSTTKEEQESLKIKVKKPSLKRSNDEVFKVKLDKEKEDAVQESETTKVVLQSNEQSEEKQEENKVGLQEVGSLQEEVKEEVTVLNQNDSTKDDTPTPIIKQEKKLPENVDKLVSFMNDTGGSMEDYVRLNYDYSNVDDVSLLKEFYKSTKPHLNSEEVDFLITENYSYLDDDEDKLKRKRDLARKEEVAKAKGFLNNLKDKYYDEVKLNSTVNPEMSKAVDFFNRYNKEQETMKAHHSDFVNNTNNYFNQDFKGFDFNVGEKKFKYNINNPNKTAEEQSNINNFVGKFLNEDGSVDNLTDYHKAIYAANNVDTIAEHFYEQGKVDALKNLEAKSKNISPEPRKVDDGSVYLNGWKVKAISGVDSSKLKIKKKTT